MFILSYLGRFLIVLPLCAAPGLHASDDVLAWLYPQLVPGSLASSEEYGVPQDDAQAGAPQGLDRLQVDAQARTCTTAGHDVFINADYQDLDFSRDLQLGPGEVVPRHLRVALVGATWVSTTGGSVIGIHADVGSASDRLFSSRRELVADATLFARLPTGPHDSWVLLLNEDSDRDVLPRIPLPAIAWEHHHSDDLELLVGLPIFYLSWKAAPWLLVEASWIENANIDTYAYLTQRWSISLSYAWYGQGFLIATPAMDGRQVVISDMRACAGISYDATPVTTVRLLAGWLFDRQAYADVHYLGIGPAANSRLLPDTPMAMLSLDID